MLYIDESRVMIKYLLPLSEIIVDFYDELKSQSSGYARLVFVKWLSMRCLVEVHVHFTVITGNIQLKFLESNYQEVTSWLLTKR